MRGLPWAATAGLLALATAGGQDRIELRYGFKKGEKFPLRLVYSVSLKLEKIPDAFQGVVGEDPINLKCEGLLDVEVVEAAPEGTARLEGRWRQLRAKGNVMVNDVDFAYDSEKKPDEKPRKKPEEEPAPGGLFNLEDQLRRMSAETLALSVDRRGRVAPAGAARRGGGALDGMFFSLHGLMGPLPEAKVGRGETWRSETPLNLPGLSRAVKLGVKSDNTLAGEEKVDDRPCWVIRSKYTVGNPEAGDVAPAVPLNVKTEGEGEGKVLFRASDGRPARSEAGLRVRITASVPDPGGGDEVEVKGSLRIGQAFEIR
jgi:hypothetical protein